MSVWASFGWKGHTLDYGPHAFHTRGDEPEKLLLGRVGRELVVERLDPDLAARFLLSLDVDLRRRVLADEDRRETDRLRESGDVLRDLRSYALGERFAVHEDSHGAKR